MESSQRLHLAVGVTPRDEQGLDAFIRELYDPSSPNYHHYLTADQFTARFGPTAQDYQALIDYAKASGLNVTRQHSNRVVLDVEGTVSDIEKALQVTLRTYQHPTEARTFYAPDTEPSVPVGIPVLHIAGLNNYTLAHPKHKRRDQAAAKSVTSKEGSAPGGQLWGNDFRYAYVPGTTLTGAGQSIGLVEFEGYYASDITSYEDAIGISANSRPQLEVVSLDGGATPQDGGDNGEECSIDIEMAVSMAPGLSKIYVFEDGGTGNGNGYFDDIFESMVARTNILQFSCSWGGNTGADPTSEVLFKQMAAQGQSFYNASGDAGAFVGAVAFPSDSPSITQVGGTTLTDGSAPSYSWQNEVVWDWDSGPNVSASEATSSSGGVSTHYPIPSWQAGINMSANLGSTSMRNIPDVAANADNCYIFSDNGEQSGGWGGTSCAAPLWAAYTALLNQQAAANQGASVGFLNPTLYALAATDNYTSLFHDVTSGNNTWKKSPSHFSATTGYDLCCGLGSMNGINLMKALLGSTNGGENPSPSGSLQVTISPAAAVTAGAQWQVDGSASQINGATVTNLSVGAHTVSFVPLSGWDSPPNQTVTINNQATTSASGIYTLVTTTSSGAGALTVTIQPSAVVSAGAQWQVDGGTAQNSGATVTNLAAGNHTVTFTGVSGWDTPAFQSVTITDDVTTTASGNYTAPNPTSDNITLITNGSGTIQHTTWPAILVTEKTYTVTAIPRVRNVFSNWTGGTSRPYSVLSLSPKYSFSMQPNLVLQANFVTNVFLGAEGTYRGLFAPTNAAREQDNSGSFTFSISGSGAMSGTLDVDGQNVPLSGKFDLGGAAEMVSKQARDIAPLTAVLQLDFAHQTVSGLVSNGNFAAELSGYRSQKTTGFEGQYTFIIPGSINPALGPFGDSYGTVRINAAGALTMVGNLADGTPISQSSVISKDGYWPLYIKLYGGNGSLWGWNYFNNQALNSSPSISWINGGNSSKTAFYRIGFTNQQATLAGGLYLSSETLPANLTATFAGGDLTSPVTNNAKTSAGDKIILSDGSGQTDKLSLTVQESSGLISGSFANPVDSKQIINVHGVILQGQTNAQGYFLGTNQSGTFTLGPP